jgi:chorismate synthase
MNNWGNILKLSIFGESHGQTIGIIIGGLPPGVLIDEARIEQEMRRRAPGTGSHTTARKESDRVHIVSGVNHGRSTGAPLCGLIENADQRASDYGKILRPGHADWTALMKYWGFAEMSGGGHFSGRLTAPIVFAGAVAKTILEENEIEIYARIKGIAGKSDAIDLTKKRVFSDGKEVEQLRAIAGKAFPASDKTEAQFKEIIAKAKADEDSVGGVIETIAFGVPGGLGEPFFDSVESRLSSLFFSIPAVKGVEFGKGFAISAMRGSEANDSLRVDDGMIYAATNNNGGVLGGIANGMPIIARVALKPTPSIGKPQLSVDPELMQEKVLKIKGRHDPCIVPRAVPVVESCMALGLLDLLFEAWR